MRWIPFLILVYVIVLAQTTVGRLLLMHTTLGDIGPDFMAMAAVFFAFHIRLRIDALLAAWIMGSALGLTIGGAAGNGAVVGPMALCYVLATWVVFLIRESLFRERVLTQALITLMFVMVAHGTWIVLQSLLAGGAWRSFWRMELQALTVAVFTAVLSPLGQYLLNQRVRWFMLPVSGRRSRTGR